MRGHLGFTLEMSLKDCYERIMRLDPDLEIDSFDVAEEVCRIRQFWKPESVRVVLLAESHAYTRQQDFVNSWQIPRTVHHGKFVRFVYCLANGESSLVPSIHRNPGTSQFWKILFSCLNQVSSSEDFGPILRSTPTQERIANKIELLSGLKQAGIWLIDASIVGINRLKDPNARRRVLEYCESYTIPILQGLKPSLEHVIIIGATARDALRSKITSLGIGSTPFPQPQARIPMPGYFQYYKSYFEVCSKFKN